MATLTKNSLMCSENLTLPSVIVMTANMGCAKCRQKVCQVISKITGLTEYTVDIPNRQVTVKGDFGFRGKIEDYSSRNQTKSRFFKSFRTGCFTWCATIE